MNGLANTRKKIKVLLLHSVLVDRGVERILLAMCRHFNRARFEISVCVLRNKAPMLHAFAKERFTVHVLGGKPAPFLSAMLQLYRLLKTEHIDVVHIHGIRAAIIGRPIAWLARVPVIIYSVHNRWGNWLHFLLDRATTPFGDGVYPFSDAVRSFLLHEVGIPKRYLKQTIRIGIDLKKFQQGTAEKIDALRKELNIAPTDLVVGSVGALTEQKGFAFLLQAVPQILAKLPNVKFLIVGDGELRDELQDLAKRLNISEHILLTGNRTDVHDILHLMDLFVLPSLWEGLSQALVEATAVGKPAVVTRVDGNPEVVTHGENGFLVEPGDINGLAKALVQILTSPELRERMSIAAARRAESEFSVERMIKDFEHVYLHHLESHGR